MQPEPEETKEYLLVRNAGDRMLVKKQLERMRSGLVEYSSGLKTIHANKAWRADYESFDAFCRQEFGYGEDRAYQLMQADGAKNALIDQFASEGNTKMVEAVKSLSEAAVRPLLQMPEANRADVLKEASKKTNGRIKSPDIKIAGAALGAYNRPAPTPRKINLRPSRAQEADSCPHCHRPY